MDAKTVDKPPIGLRPHWIWAEGFGVGKGVSDCFMSGHCRFWGVDDIRITEHVLSERIQEIYDAMARYIASDKEIYPLEWEHELNLLEIHYFNIAGRYYTDATRDKKNI